MEGLEAMGFEDATPIQELAIPEILNGKDVLGCAQTGTGKTAAFVLPILELLSRKKNSNKVDCLILVPTRELALQIDQQIEAFGYFTEVSALPIYGGGNQVGWTQQKNALIQGADIIIATPGRLLAHMKLGYVKLEEVKYFVLDEADRMLDMGFQQDIINIRGKMPNEKQTLFFSATMPHKIRQFAKKMLFDPKEINIATSKPAEKIKQGMYFLFEPQKISLIASIMKHNQSLKSIIIFTSRKRKVEEIKRSLNRNNIKALYISSDLDQSEREKALLDFRNKKARVVVATDILARGIDIKDIDMVINYDVPRDPEDYVHRIGRTARAEADGEAITFVTESDFKYYSKIKRFLEKDIPVLELPKELGGGPDITKLRAGGRRPSGGRRSNQHRNKGGRGPKNRNYRGGNRNKSKGPKKDSN